MRRPRRPNGSRDLRRILASRGPREVDPFSSRYCPFRSCVRNCAFRIVSRKKKKTKSVSFVSTRRRIPNGAAGPFVKTVFLPFPLFSLSLFLSLFLFLSLANQQIAVRWEWKFGTINSNGAYVLGDLLLGSLLDPAPRAPASSTGTRSSPD